MICTCPECGKKFDSEKKRCNHCGCTIKVCPECGNIVKEDLQICDFCGMEFASIEKINEEKKRKITKQVKKDAAVLNSYCERITTNISKLSALLLVLALVLFAVAVIKAFTIDLEKLFEQKISASDFRDKIKNYVIFGGILLSLSFIIKNLNHIFAFPFVSKKVKELNFNIDEYIKTISVQDVAFDLSKTNLIIRYVKESFYLDKEFWKLVIYVIFQVIVIYLICKGVWIIGEEFLISKLWTSLIGSQPKFNFNINSTLIYGFIGEFVLVLYNVFLLTPEESILSWINTQKKLLNREENI